jgi:hypothetical protein
MGIRSEAKLTHEAKMMIANPMIVPVHNATSESGST